MREVRDTEEVEPAEPERRRSLFSLPSLGGGGALRLMGRGASSFGGVGGPERAKRWGVRDAEGGTFDRRGRLVFSFFSAPCISSRGWSGTWQVVAAASVERAMATAL